MRNLAENRLTRLKSVAPQLNGPPRADNIGRDGGRVLNGGELYRRVVHFLTSHDNDEHQSDFRCGPSRTRGFGDLPPAQPPWLRACPDGYARSIGFEGS